MVIIHYNLSTLTFSRDQIERGQLLQSTTIAAFLGMTLSIESLLMHGFVQRCCILFRSENDKDGTLSEQSDQPVIISTWNFIPASKNSKMGYICGVYSFTHFSPQSPSVSPIPPHPLLPHTLLSLLPFHISYHSSPTSLSPLTRFFPLSPVFPI